MNYALRNTLILIVLLLFVFAGFFVVNSKSRKKLNVIQASYNDNVTSLEDLKATNPDLKDKDEIIQSLEDMEEKVKRESKLISTENNPTITYRYLLDICDNYCPEVKFNFQLTRSGQVENARFHSYTLNGSAPIQAVYTFLYQIEKQVLLYTIESLKLTENIVEALSTKKINFTIVLNAYYNKDAQTFKQASFRRIPYKRISYDPLYSRIHAPIPLETQEKLLDVRRSILIGLTADKVFVKDQDGIIQILSIGDEVAYGYLHSINWNEQTAIFKVNEIGITQDIMISIEKKDE